MNLLNVGNIYRFDNHNIHNVIPSSNCDLTCIIPSLDTFVIVCIIFWWMCCSNISPCNSILVRHWTLVYWLIDINRTCNPMPLVWLGILLIISHIYSNSNVQRDVETMITTITVKVIYGANNACRYQGIFLSIALCHAANPRQWDKMAPI